MTTGRTSTALGLALSSLLFHGADLSAALSADAVGKLQEDVLAIVSVRDGKLKSLAGQYKANDEKEPARAFKITMPFGMVRTPMHFEMRRWGGKWLPGVSILPHYNKSRNAVDSTGCVPAGNSITGRVEVTLVSDGWVPAPGLAITLVYDINAVIRNGGITGTYRAHENRDMSHSVPENEVKYEQTGKMEVRRGSIRDVLRLLPRTAIHQYEHKGELSGTVESLEFGIDTPVAIAKRALAGLGQPELYAVAVELEREADEAYRQVRATLYVRMLGVPYESALAMALARPCLRPDFDAGKAEDQLADMQGRLQRMRGLLEAIETWKPDETPCPVGRLGTDDPRFRGHFCIGPFPEDDGRPNIVPAADPAAGEAWRYVRNWAILGRYSEDRLRRQLLPVPELIPAMGAVYRPDHEPFDPTPKKDRNKPEEPEAKVRPEDRRVGWRQLASQQNPFADFGSVAGDARHVVAYGITELFSEAEQEVWAALEPHDFCQLWLNDRLIWANYLPQRDASVFRMKLRNGRNTVMVRCDNDTHEWGVSFMICTHGRPRTAGEVAAAADAVTTPALTTAGWFGPGHKGVYPDANPVTAWDIDKGINVLWRLPFHRKSISTPVIVADRIFTQAEPHTLVCVDKFRGKVMWQRDSNILEFLEDPEERRQALADWERESADPTRATNKEELDGLQRALAEVSVQLKADEDNEALQKRGAEIEAQIGKIQGKSQRLGNWFRRVGSGAIDPTGHGGWFQSYVGYTAGTPVTDGKHVWVKYGTGVAACYDPDGNRKWIKRTKFGATASTTSMPSPMLVDGKVIIVGSGGRTWQKMSKSRPLSVTEHGGQLGAWMIALDQETGELAWDAGPIRHVKYGICNTPYPMKLSNGSDEMWVIVTSTGQMLRAADGKQLLDHVGVRACFHASPVFYGNNVFLSRGGHVDAVEVFMRDRDTVGARHLWTSSGGGSAGTVLYEGLLHCTRSGFDKGAAGALSYRAKEAANGADVALIDPCLPGGSGDPYISAIAAGKYIFAFGGSAGAVIEAGRNPRVIARMKNERMYAHPVFEDDRMYLRTYDSLLCIGQKGAEGEKFVREMQARTIIGMFPSKIRRVMTTDVVSRGDIDVGPGTPVGKIITGAMPGNWIHAGPLPLPGAGDPLESIGGRAKALPVEGTEFAAGGKKYAFARLDARHFDGAAIEVEAGPDGGKGSEHYYYTVLDNSLGRKVLRMILKGPSAEAWVAGQKIRDGGVVLVDGIGLLPLLIRVEFGAGLPPFHRRGKLVFYSEEVDDPTVEFREQMAFLRQNEDALRRVLEYMPGSVPATRAQYLLGFVEAGNPNSEESD